ncbi:type II toxin-antitoxin system RelE/ParE family toxin [Rhodoplanes sp. SY1]|uniref:type II toxin-antitoxin system RelE/ParE family toxin n=1 Tax=Rhodoplanes sp. SY1 TaxID=3166646 RepID=UPI0038B55400
MRRLKVRYRPEALADLEDIFRVVLHLSSNQITAERFVDRIRRRCRRIGNVPLGSRARDDLEPGLRTAPFEHSAVIAYTVEDDCVRIVNIFYSGRDYEALYRNQEPAPESGEENT